jgi:hypothetical protein
VSRFDAATASTLPGVVKVFAVAPYNGGGSGGVAVIADNPFHVMNALDKVTVESRHDRNEVGCGDFCGGRKEGHNHRRFAGRRTLPRP